MADKVGAQEQTRIIALSGNVVVASAADECAVKIIPNERLVLMWDG